MKQASLLKEAFLALDKLQHRLDHYQEDIAIIGMDCRFPGGIDSPDAFWEVLKKGEEVISDVPDDRWQADAFYDANSEKKGKMYSQRAGFLEDIHHFDAEFFAISPREAMDMDPQQRMLLEVSWQALERAGAIEDRLAGSNTGVFVGITTSDHAQIRLGSGELEKIGSYDISGNTLNTAAGRLSFQYGFHGPTMAIDTACSSSLVAIHQACQSLRQNECEQALAAGVNLILTPAACVALCETHALSPTGHCRAFSEQADGMVRGEGCAVLVLKRHSNAIQNKDPILAVIRGSAINHDGPSSALMVPNGTAQEALLKQALNHAKLTADQVDYIEAHGTGTPLGDPIEAKALNRVFAPKRPAERPLLIGSVKTNMGHLEACAGIASVMKVVLALQHQQIPAHLHFNEPSVHIDWKKSVLQVPKQLQNWPKVTDKPAIAGISAFGFSGTNAHLLLAEAEKSTPIAQASTTQLFTLAAQSSTALMALAAQFSAYLSQSPASIQDICYTVNTGRADLDYRLAFVADSHATLKEQCRMLTAKKINPSKIAFLFSGQGSQYVGMAEQLYQTYPLFRHYFDQCDTLLQKAKGFSLKTILFVENNKSNTDKLKQTQYTQPALFIVEYALAMLWQSWGIKPTALHGHSIGEYVAACLAQVFSVEDALKLVLSRASLMQALTSDGSMLAVIATATQMQSYLSTSDVSIAAINGPKSLVLSGTTVVIEQLCEALEAEGFSCKYLAVSQAFHSPLMEPILGEFSKVAKSIQYSIPKITLISNLTGKAESKAFTQASYWVQHLRETVQFAAGIKTLQQQDYQLFVEIGAKPILSSLFNFGHCIASLRPGEQDQRMILKALGELYCAGVVIDWAGFYQHNDYQRVVLPVYPFAKTVYRIDAAKVTAQFQGKTSESKKRHPLLGMALDIGEPEQEIQSLCYQSALQQDSPLFLAHHQLFQWVVLPAAAYLEMCFVAAQQLPEAEGICLQQIHFQKALILPEKGAVKLQLKITATTSQVYDFNILAKSKQWQHYVDGVITTIVTSPESMALATLKQRINTAESIDLHYQTCANNGVHFGPYFQALQQLFSSEEEALGYIVLPEPLMATASDYYFHPVLLDAGLQVLNAISAKTIKTSVAKGDLYIPAEIEKILCFQAPQNTLWCYARFQARLSSSALLVVDFHFFNDAGEKVAEIHGLQLKRSNQKALIDRMQADSAIDSDYYYELIWRLQANEEKRLQGQSWLLVATKDDFSERLCERLRAMGDQCVVVDSVTTLFNKQEIPEFSGIIQLSFSDEQRLSDLSAIDLLETIKKQTENTLHIVQQGPKVWQTLPNLWLLTKGVTQGSDPRQAPLWGMAKVISLEYPDWHCVSLDFDNENQAQILDDLLFEIHQPGKEKQIAYQKQQRHVARLIGKTLPNKPFKCQANKSYLITGGLKGLGFVIAELLVTQGAGHLVLTGRSTPDKAILSKIAKWQKNNVEVTIAQVDVTAYKPMQALIKGIPNLAGIVHSAGLLADAVLEQQNWQNFATVMQPKIVGGWNLHRLSEDLKLDFFVLFSSVASLWGSPSQANHAASNAFLDALAHYRQGQGLTATSINWGAWSEVGVAANEIISQRIHKKGLLSLTPKQGCAAFGQILAQPLTQIGVVPINWPKFIHTSLAHRPVFFAELMAQYESSTPIKSQQVVTTKSDFSLLLYLQKIVAEALRLPLEKVNPEQAMNYMGVDSLMAVELKNCIRKDLGVDIAVVSFLDGASIIELVQKIEPSLSLSPTPPQSDKTANSNHLSQAQQALWLLAKQYPNSAAYNVTFTANVLTEFDERIVSQAMQHLLTRHQTLCHYFILQEGQLIQQTHPPKGSVESLSIPFSVNDPQFRQRVVQAYARPFDLTQDLLFRLTLFSDPEKRKVLSFVLHHIICDAWSIWLIVDEFLQIYQALSENKRIQLAPLHHTYADFVNKQTVLLASTKGAELKAYWLQTLSALPILQLPADYSESIVNQGESFTFRLAEHLTHCLQQLASREGVTLYTLLVAAFQVLLHRYSGHQDILLGSPVSGRDHSEFESVVGYFVNQIVLRSSSRKNPKFRHFLSQCRQTVLDAMTHQDYPFPELVKVLKPARDAGRSPIFQAYFVLQQPQKSNRAIDASLQLSEFFVPQMLGQFDLSLEMLNQDGELSSSFKYNALHYSLQNIKSLCGHWQQLLTEIVAQPDTPLNAFNLISAKERQILLNDRQGNQQNYAFKPLHEHIETQVLKTPNACALIFAETQLSYQQLNAQANQLAWQLRDLGAKPGIIVGVRYPRCIEMVVAMLAILKTGAAYLPIDPDYPQARIDFILEDAELTLIISEQWQYMTHYATHNLNIKVSLDDLAYVIYTSGSTGQPKGAMNTHAAISNRLLWMCEAYAVDCHDIVLQKTPFSFDVSVWEFFLPLMVGARLILAKPKGHLDSLYLVSLIREQRVSLIHFVPSMLQVFLMTPSLSTVGSSLRHVICSGEALSRDLQQQFYKALEKVSLHNLYGPTEAAIDVSHWPCRSEIAYKSVPIGYPIANIQCYILDEQKALLPLGLAGELYIGGVGLARGYLNRPELTAEKFIKSPFNEAQRLYKTGDWVRYFGNGSIEYLGRIDHQVKLRGFRIELGEIETLLNAQENVREAVILLRGQGIEQHLVAYYVGPQDASQLKLELKKQLPDYMIPKTFIGCTKMPLNSNGKVDRQALAKIKGISKSSTMTKQVMPLHKKLRQIWQNVLEHDNIRDNDNFFDLGGHSLLLMQVQQQLQDELNQPIPLLDLFQYTTIDTLVCHLSNQQQAIVTAKPSVKSIESEGIAIIGLACRFPGADNVEQFWQNLANGVESVRFFSDQELLAAGVSAALLEQPNYVKANACLEDIEHFDAKFFGYSPNEAQLLDPQQRLFLQIAWQGIEHAGYDVTRLAEKTSVFAGVGLNQYLLHNIASRPDIMQNMGGYQIMLSSDKDFLASRVAYQLNLKGPAVTVQTACSTSLVAVHMACQSLLRGESDMALAGGATVLPQQTQGYLYEENMILSPDGHCRPFDAKAKGTIGGSGVGCVILKRVSEAIAAGDCIYAVIKASQINNDGALKAGYTAPGVIGQQAVIKAAMQGIDYESISYIEAHGTGTVLGDPLEISALTQVYQAETKRTQYCALGSVKSNVGHLDAAAGVASLIKTTLALSKQQLPPSINYEQANDKIDFSNTPFYVNTQLSDWQPKQGRPRRAGISSFGIGGTNAHVILQQADKKAEKKSIDTPQLLLLSARTESALLQMGKNLAQHLQENPQQPFNHVAYTLAMGRKVLDYSCYFISKNREDAIEQLKVTESLLSVENNLEKPTIVFLLPGQGSQYPDMAKTFYEQYDCFRHYADQCFTYLQEKHDMDIKSIIYDPQYHIKLSETRYTQPALFVIEYALAQCYIEWGIQPQKMLGHSLGEYVAACLADVFSLFDGLDIVVHRAQWIADLDSGKMLSVGLSVANLQNILKQQVLQDKVAIAANNAPNLCCVSGTPDTIADLQQYLQQQKIDVVKLQTSHAFHSQLMEPVMQPLTTLLTGINLQAPKIPYISNLTGTWITAEQAQSADYWAQHLRQTVQFSTSVATLLTDDSLLIIEVGPGRTLKGLIQQQNKQVSIYQSLAHVKDARTSTDYLQSTLGQLHLRGFTVFWQKYYHPDAQQRVALPTYPFAKQRHWIARQEQQEEEEEKISHATTKQSIDHWFYGVSWRRTLVSQQKLVGQHYLLFMQASDFRDNLVEHLLKQGHEVICVGIAEDFNGEKTNYAINPKQADHYQQLWAALGTWTTDHLIYAWSLSNAPDLCFDALLLLLQNLSFKTLRMTFFSSNIYSASPVLPEQYLLLGAVKVMQQEYPQWQIQVIDLTKDKIDLPYLIKELQGSAVIAPSHALIALQNSQRWEQYYSPLPLLSAVDPQAAGIFRKQGCYLITGGLGGMGLVFAEYLACHFQAKLILLGRSVYPEKVQWPESKQPTIKKLMALQQQGADITLLSVEVADVNALQTALAPYKKIINGVIHAAGVACGELISQQTLTATQAIFSAKVAGTRALHRVFEADSLDFMLFCSSVTAIRGAAGQVDYAAANAFMDGFALALKQQGKPVYSINWDTWQQVGMAVDNQVNETLKQAILPTQGLEVMTRVLQQPQSQVIVATRNLSDSLAALDKQWQHYQSLTKDESSDVSSQLSILWQALLGVNKVQDNDDFFELGGHSLLATLVISRILETFAVTLTLDTFFRLANFSKMVAYIEDQQLANTDDNLLAQLLDEIESGQLPLS